MTKTLLKVPDLVMAVQPLVNRPVNARSIFELIGEGKIKPMGYLQQIPLFDVGQIGEVVQALQQGNNNE
jgi:hypothetical protein